MFLHKKQLHIHLCDTFSTCTNSPFLWTCFWETHSIHLHIIKADEEGELTTWTLAQKNELCKHCIHYSIILLKVDNYHYIYLTYLLQEIVVYHWIIIFFCLSLMCIFSLPKWFVFFTLPIGSWRNLTIITAQKSAVSEGTKTHAIILVNWHLHI